MDEKIVNKFSEDVAKICVQKFDVVQIINICVAAKINNFKKLDEKYYDDKITTNIVEYICSFYNGIKKTMGEEFNIEKHTEGILYSIINQIIINKDILEEVFLKDAEKSILTP